MARCGILRIACACSGLCGRETSRCCGRGRSCRFSATASSWSRCHLPCWTSAAPPGTLALVRRLRGRSGWSPSCCSAGSSPTATTSAASCWPPTSCGCSRSGRSAGLSLGGVLEIWHLWLLAFVFGAGEGFAGPAIGAIVPELVPDGRGSCRPTRCRARCARRAAARRPRRSAAWSSRVLGTGGALLVDAGTFVVSIACLLAMRARVPVHEGEHEPLRAQLREAARVRARRRRGCGRRWSWPRSRVLAFLGPDRGPAADPDRRRARRRARATSASCSPRRASARRSARSRVGQLGIPRREITALYWFWGLAGFALVGYALADAVWQLVVFGVPVRARQRRRATRSGRRSCRCACRSPCAGASRRWTGWSRSA